MRVHFVRHGESVSNAHPTAVSLPDETGDRLTERGREQARAVAPRLAAAGAERILTSPLRRARETAEAISEELGLEIVELPELRELRESEGYGELPPEEQRLRRWSVWMAEHGFDPDHSYRGGESFNEIRGRVQSVKARLLDDGDDVIAVSHGIFLRFFLVATFLGDEFPATQVGRLWQLGTVNCGLSVFEHRRAYGENLPATEWRCLTWMERPPDPGRP